MQQTNGPEQRACRGALHLRNSLREQLLRAWALLQLSAFQTSLAYAARRNGLHDVFRHLCTVKVELSQPRSPILNLDPLFPRSCERRWNARKRG